jgi:hypothetical protein
LLCSKLIEAYVPVILQMKDLGPCQYFVGVQIVRNRNERTISLVQDAYVDKVLKPFGLSE